MFTPTGRRRFCCAIYARAWLSIGSVSVCLSVRLSVTRWGVKTNDRNIMQFSPLHRLFFAARCYASTAYAIMQCPSACRSVCLSRSYILSKQVLISSDFFHRRVATVPHHSSFSMPNGRAIFRRGLQGGMKKSRFWPISRFISEMMQDRTIGTIKGE